MITSKITPQERAWSIIGGVLLAFVLFVLFVVGGAHAQTAQVSAPPAPPAWIDQLAQERMQEVYNTLLFLQKGLVCPAQQTVCDVRVHVDHGVASFPGAPKTASAAAAPPPATAPTPAATAPRR